MPILEPPQDDFGLFGGHSEFLQHEGAGAERGEPSMRYSQGGPNEGADFKKLLEASIGDMKWPDSGN